MSNEIPIPTISKLPEMPDVEWVKPPTFTDLAPAPVRGASGTLAVSLTGDGTAFVRTLAHVNDDAPAVTVRGYDYLVSLHMIRDAATGEWSEHPERTTYAITRRHYMRSVAPTIRAAIVDLCASTVASVWSPDLNRQARYARATMRYSTLRSRLDGTRELIDELRADRAAIVVELNLNR